MSDIRLAMEMTFVSTPHGSDEQFEEFMDAVQEHLDAIGREVQIAASLTDRTAEFATSVEDTSFENAAAGLLADLRTALHAAGASTDGWPRFEPTDRSVRELQDA